MSGFNFNTPNTNKGFTFGTPATTASTGFGGFAAPTAQPNTSGFNFGSPAAPANTSSGFNFNASTSINPTPGFGIGSGSAAPSFAAAPAPAPAFGAPTAAPAFGTPTAAPAFGTTAAPAFGTTAAPAFGTSAAALPFGGIPTATVPAFGSAAATSAPAFGAASSTVTPGFGGNIANTAPAFGATPAAALPAFGTPASTGLNFGPTPATAAPAFGATNTSTGFNFAAPGTNITTTSSNFPSFNFNTTATSAPGTGAPNFSLGGVANPQNTSASLSFGTNTTTATLFGNAPTAGGGGLFGTKPLFGAPGSTPATSTLTGLTLTANVTAKPSAGLGGVDLNATQPKSLEGKQDNIKIKDIIIPDQISETVENLKNFIKHQKSTSSDIARATVRKLSNVSAEIQQFEWALREIANSCEKNYTQIKLLRSESSRAIQSAEMAQRTHETPIGLQFENIMPLQYFQDVVKKYEADIIAFRNQVELTEKYMLSLANPQSFTPEDLKRGLKQIHESFISLAGRVHEIHQKVEAQKEHYLNLRKYYLRDTQNVFVQLEKENADSSAMSNITAGPTPFSLMSNITWQASKATHHNPTAGGPNFHNMTAATNNPIQNQSMLGSNLTNPTLFGTGNTSGLPAFGTPFNLQTPPMGAKRNKQ